ncbi:hypothetical protein [Shewanella sp. HL-SH2]|uniref:hypothetical protein n=1 Tax=Shewanella sp. HL-SH2 TaxID=3436238 RepID=UPI003EBCF276
MKHISIYILFAFLCALGSTACEKEDSSTSKRHNATKVIINQSNIKMTYQESNSFEPKVASELQILAHYSDYPYVVSQSQHFTLLQPPIGLEGIFTLTVREKLQDYTQIELLFNNRLLYSRELNQASFGGYCQMPQTKALVFFIDSVNEGIDTYKHQILYESEAQGWLAKELPGQDSPTIFDAYSRCEFVESNNAIIANNKTNLAECSCALNDSVFSVAQTKQWQTAIGNTEVALFELPSSFQQGQPQTLNLYPITDQAALQVLINKAERDVSFELSRINVDSRTVLTVSLNIEPYFNLGYGFLWDNERWYLWYTAGDSSKFFQPITQLKQTGEHTVSMELCTNDCNWWGKRTDIEIDLATLTFRKTAAEK